MRIKVDFSIDVPPESLPALRELAAANDNETARLFVKGDAQEYVIKYLEDNGVRVTVVRDSAVTF